MALVGRDRGGEDQHRAFVGRFVCAMGGKLRLNGIDPRQISEHERQRLIGVVPQVVQLFSGTVLDNLTLEDDSVRLDAVENAARTSGADAFIRSLPQGYETVINSGSGEGMRLSSGQRQLLSLTRALIRNPAVLLFDEATSAIDSASEAAFRQVLEQESALHRRAILTVAHRLSTARGCRPGDRFGARAHPGNGNAG